jgi:hypothetical protein
MLQQKLIASGHGVVLLRSSVPQTNERRASLSRKRLMIELTGLRTSCVLIDRFRAGLNGRCSRRRKAALHSNVGCWEWWGRRCGRGRRHCANPAPVVFISRVAISVGTSGGVRPRSFARLAPAFAALAPPLGTISGLRQRRNLRRSDCRSRSILDQGRPDRLGRSGSGVHELEHCPSYQLILPPVNFRMCLAGLSTEPFR